MDGWEQRRGQLEDVLAAGYRESDKLIVTVSSGVVAFAAAFLRDINDRVSPGFVGFACGSLLAAIALVLLSLFAERVELRKRINDLNIKHEEGGLTWRNVLIEALNILSTIAFFVGIASIAWFLIVNFWEER